MRRPGLLPAPSLDLGPRFPRTRVARQPGACEHKEGWSGRSGPVSASGPGGGSSQAQARPPPWMLGWGDLGRSGAAGAQAGQAGEGFPTAKARRTVTSLARPQAWGRESHERAGIGSAADSAGNFSLSPYFLPLVGTASWPHARELSGRTGWTVVGPGFSWAADIINSFPHRLGSQTLAGRLDWEGWEH